MVQLGRTVYDHEIQIYLLQVHNFHWDGSSVYTHYIMYGAYAQHPVHHDVTVTDNTGHTYVIRAGKRFQEGDLVMHSTEQTNSSTYEPTNVRHGVSVSPTGKIENGERYLYTLEDTFEMSWTEYNSSNPAISPTVYNVSVKPHASYTSNFWGTGCTWSWDGRYAFTVSTQLNTYSGSDRIEYDGKSAYIQLNGSNRNIEDVIDYIELSDRNGSARKYLRPGSSTSYSNQLETYRYFTRRGLFNNMSSETYKSFTWDLGTSGDWHVTDVKFKSAINMGTASYKVAVIDEAQPKNGEFQWWW